MTQEFPAPIQLIQMPFGFATSRAVGMAAERCIADLVKNEAKSADELDRQTVVHTRSLYRLLRAGASMGVFSEDSKNALILPFW